MINRTLKTTTGEYVYVYDEVFTRNEMFHFKNFVENSRYQILRNTIDDSEYSENYLIQSFFSDSDVQNFGIFDSPSFEPIKTKHLLNRKNISNWVIASNHSTKNYFHCDYTSPSIQNTKPCFTVLYYINLKWELNNGGETLFCNSKGEVELAVSPKPNRVVVFDSYLLHKPTTIDFDVMSPRFAFVSKFAEI